MRVSAWRRLASRFVKITSLVTASRSSCDIIYHGRRTVAGEMESKSAQTMQLSSCHLRLESRVEIGARVVRQFVQSNHTISWNEDSSDVRRV